MTVNPAVWFTMILRRRSREENIPAQIPRVVGWRFAHRPLDELRETHQHASIHFSFRTRSNRFPSSKSIALFGLGIIHDRRIGSGFETRFNPGRSPASEIGYAHRSRFRRKPGFNCATISISISASGRSITGSGSSISASRHFHTCAIRSSTHRRRTH